VIRRITKGPLFAIGCLAAAFAQSPPRLTRAEAEQMALRNHPQVRSAALAAEAAQAATGEAQAALYPQVAAAFTSVGADHDSTLAAGTVQTSSLYSRVASGLTLSQLITDFGRTTNLAASARLRATAQQQAAANTRATVVEAVDQAYYQALSARSVLQIARAVVENRRLTLRQVQALAESSLKSTLDVSFAEVALSDAELALVRAENGVQAGRARLAASLGLSQAEQFELADEPLPPALEPDAETLVAQALRQRPDLAAMESNRAAAHRFAAAEGDLSRPTVSVVAVAGGLPATDPHLRGNYSAAGVNVSVPVLNGKLYAARRREAELRSQAADQDVEELEVEVAEQVRLAWLDADTASRALAVTARLVAQAEQSLRLAQLRYDNGLGSIVELNQAQVSQVAAEIAAASAKYEYLAKRAALAFAAGELP
jgi:outer membrane protein